MKQKPITEAERRQQLEMAAADKRAQEARERAETEAEKIEMGQNCYSNIWSGFSKDSKKSKSLAYSNLKNNLAEFAEFIVPHIVTAKEHMALITEAEKFISGGDTGQTQEDPRTVIADWLSGRIELSRIPLEKPIAVPDKQEL